MILIADSGSTKTTWMEVESGNKIVTEGLNPYFTSDEQFFTVCQQVREYWFGLTHSSTTASRRSPSPNLGEEPIGLNSVSCSPPKLGKRNASDISGKGCVWLPRRGEGVCEQTTEECVSIFFYGAGCGSEVQRQRVKTLLQKAFDTMQVEVETDMLGACRAACGRDAGLVGILGTGSNACYYDGEKIVHQAVSTGYILGDHGSANHVGRMLLQDYLSSRMPEGVSAVFHESYPQTKDEFIDAVYHQPNANRFLASLAPFALCHARYTYCFFTVVNSLKDWYTYQLFDIVMRTGCHELNIVGGFGAAIKSPMARFEEDCNIVVKKRLADPIDGLRKYHKQKGNPHGVKKKLSR